MTDPLDTLETPEDHTRRDTVRSLWVFLGAAGVMLLFVAGLHLFGVWQYARAGDASLTTLERVQAADTARRIEPFEQSWKARYGALRAQYAYEAATKFYAEGELVQAVDAMTTAYRYAVGNKKYLAYFVKLQDDLTAATNRKAHLQHGHEGPGGTLRPQDIER